MEYIIVSASILGLLLAGVFTWCLKEVEELEKLKS
jgi:hypothetical protein